MEDIKLQLSHYYDTYASARNLSPRDPWKCNIRTYFKDFLISRKIRNILEIGAGTGQDSEFFLQAGLQVTSIDFSEESVLLCRKRGIHALVMDFYHMTFNDHEFESLYAFNCLFHVPSADTGAVFKELARVIRPGGFLLIGQRGGISFEGHYRISGKTESRLSVTYELAEYEKILRQYFLLTESHVLPVKDYEFHWFIVENPTFTGIPEECR
jgi:SAM-dependent methyltransferase